MNNEASSEHEVRSLKFEVSKRKYTEYQKFVKKALNGRFLNFAILTKLKWRKQGPSNQKSLKSFFHDEVK